MTIKEARELIGNRATWELKVMRRALSNFPALNTAEENKYLEAVKLLLRRAT